MFFNEYLYIMKKYVFMFWASKNQTTTTKADREKRKKKRKKPLKGNISCYLNVFYITF